MSEIHDGDVFGGKYKITRQLGAGAMGAVYEATNAWTGRTVALKVLLPTYDKDAEIVKRFMLEAQTAAQLAHPNIVDVLDMGREESGRYYIVQACLTGMDLKKFMRDSGALGAREALDLMVPIMGALIAAHDRKIIHRDIKPANIFLARDLAGGVVPTLIDFGISKVMDERGVSLIGTGTGVVLGTARYMPPEQARGELLDARIDVWALGAVLFELLANRPLYDAPSYGELLAKLLRDRPERIEHVAPGTPPEVAAMLHRAIEPDLTRRYASMREFLQAALACGVAQRHGDDASLAERHRRSIAGLLELPPPGVSRPTATSAPDARDASVQVLVDDGSDILPSEGLEAHMTGKEDERQPPIKLAVQPRPRGFQLAVLFALGVVCVVGVVAVWKHTEKMRRAPVAILVRPRASAVAPRVEPVAALLAPAPPAPTAAPLPSLTPEHVALVSPPRRPIIRRASTERRQPDASPAPVQIAVPPTATSDPQPGFLTPNDNYRRPNGETR